MVESLTAPAFDMIRVSFEGAGIALVGGLAWTLLFRVAVPLWARRCER
jgi:hypothetical protein